jgi:diacylglycerol kinase (ATP)
MQPFGTTTMENPMYIMSNEVPTMSTIVQSSRQRARVICNPSSGGGKCDPCRLQEQLAGFELDWIETRSQGDALAAAEEWKDGLLIAAGGDGTVNEVVNGLGRSGFPETVTLALLPTGTGNDLAATLAIPVDAGEAATVIRQGRIRTLDVARVRSEPVSGRFFVNVATGGLGAEISGANGKELKSRWGKLSYLRAALAVARDFDPQEVKLTLDGEERMVCAVNIMIGNCRYAGGGWLAAPRANPEDGLLDVVVVEKPGIGGPRACRGLASGSDYLDERGVFFARATEILMETESCGLGFTVDGEVICNEPAEFMVLPRALKVVVGPEY